MPAASVRETAESLFEHMKRFARTNCTVGSDLCKITVLRRITHSLRHITHARPDIGSTTVISPPFPHCLITSGAPPLMSCMWPALTI